MSKDYQPYGKEWKQEMAKFPKSELIIMLANAYKQINSSDEVVKKPEFTPNHLFAKDLLFQFDKKPSIENIEIIVKILESNSNRKDHEICDALGIVKKYNRAVIRIMLNLK